MGLTVGRVGRGPVGMGVAADTLRADNVTGSGISDRFQYVFDNTEFPNPAPERGPGSAGSRGRCLLRAAGL